VLVLAIAGCAAAVTGTRSAFHTAARGPRTTPVPGAAPARVDYDRQIAVRFDQIRAEHKDLGYADLLRELDVARAPDARPSFDPTGVDYYKDIQKSLRLTAEEQEIFKRTGIVGVDHDWRYNMGSAYEEIYRHDLPVLVTTDSILHAMHRSFDDILIEIETGIFAPTIGQLLAETHERLQAEVADGKKDPELRKSVEDVDLYITVARNLGAAVSRDPRCVGPDSYDDLCADKREADSEDTELLVKSGFGQDRKAREVLKAIVAAVPDAGVSLYGRAVAAGPYVDWTQFKPRGHYTKSPALRRYFRIMMWLGRMDVGFKLAPGPAEFGKADVDRELRDAALLSWTVRNARQLEPLASVDRAIGFLVGLSDNVTAADMVAACQRADMRAVVDLSNRETLGQLRQELRNVGAQRIRSQFGYRAPGDASEVPLPEAFQLFGQRFVIDSFVTAKVVFDSIMFKGEQQRRPMPTGLDVMAALGSDEAVGLAQPEIAQWNYATNLLAARRVVEERPPDAWGASQYDLWLSALSMLDDVPAGTDFPEVMRAQAWSRKQLQTQLGSWAELRHDTILYAKQSYTMGELCEYPTGYVEPYPEFFARVAQFAEVAGERLHALKFNTIRIRNFLGGFAAVVRRLEGLARKELTGQAFTDDEKKWLKEVVRKEMHGGCGAPTIEFTGWYRDLIYSGDPDSWEPTIADVHTDPNSGAVLQVAVGDVNFLVAAIDSRGDRAAYVGPVYSYYEFTSKQRLTDEEWRSRIKAGNLPPRPEWVRAFQGKPEQRSLAKK
jgi:hypothetical protein